MFESKTFFNVLFEITYDICLRQHPSLYTSPGVSRAPWIGYSVPKNDDTYSFILLQNKFNKIKYYNYIHSRYYTHIS